MIHHASAAWSTLIRLRPLVALRSIRAVALFLACGIATACAGTRPVRTDFPRPDPSATRPVPLDAGAFWAHAQRVATPQAYRCFAHHHPDDPRADEARAKWADLVFQKLAKQTYPTSVCSDSVRFLSQHPASAHVATVRARLTAYLATMRPNAPDTPLLRLATSIVDGSLDSADPEVAAMAAMAMHRQDAKTIDALIRVLRPNAVGICGDAARRLAGMESGEATDRLLNALSNPHDATRKWACNALKSAGANALGPLTAALRDQDRLVRDAALEALAEIGDPGVGDHVCRLLGSTPDRAAAIECLGQIGDPTHVAAISAFLSDRDESTRAQACHALARIGAASVFDAVARRSATDTPRVRFYAVLHLEGFRLPGVVAALERALGDEDWSVRRAAARQLEAMEAVESAAALERAGANSDPTVRAVVALARRRPVEDVAVDVYRRRLRDSDDDVRQEAAEVLGELGSARAVDELVPRLADSNYYVRARVLQALGRLQAVRAVPAMALLLDDPERWVQWDAPGALGQLGGERAAQALIDRLARPTGELVGERIVDALGVIARREGLHVLLPALSHRDAAIRNGVAGALASVVQATKQPPAPRRPGDEAPAPAPAREVEVREFDVATLEHLLAHVPAGSPNRALGADAAEAARATPRLVQALHDEDDLFRLQMALAALWAMTPRPDHPDRDAK